MAKKKRIGGMKSRRKPAPKPDWQKPMSERMHEGQCKRPDRDNPKIVCGYPLPCPHHSVVIDLTEDPPVIAKAQHADPSQKTVKRLREIANALGTGLQEL
jgi:hypothetical protein